VFCASFSFLVATTTITVEGQDEEKGEILEKAQKVCKRVCPRFKVQDKEKGTCPGPAR
jgi:hypothetical protein